MSWRILHWPWRRRTPAVNGAALAELEAARRRLEAARRRRAEVRDAADRWAVLIEQALRGSRG